MLERELVTAGTMSTQIGKSLGSRIVGGEFSPGMLLPIESELCQIYGVSRTVIREAVKSLIAKRLVEVSTKVGTRVRPFAEWNLLDRDVLAWRLSAQFDHKIVEDIFEMRLCFEPRAAFRAARDGTAEDRQAIDAHYQELALTFAQDLSVEAVSQADLEFHLSVIKASHNGLFITIGSALRSALRVSAQMLQRHATRPAEDLVAHEAVRAAITARMPMEASEAMERLLEAARDRLLPFASKVGTEISIAPGDGPAAAL